MELAERFTRTTGDAPFVRNIVEEIIAEADPLQVIIFGSRAADTARPESDLDVLVVMPDGTDQRAAMVRIASRLPVSDVDVELLVATPEVPDRHRD